MGNTNTATIFSWDLSPLNFGADEDTISYFTLGNCNALAWELHKLTGWSLAILSSLPIKNGDYGGHAFIISTEGMAIDIKGVQTLEAIKADWDYCPHLSRFFTAKDFAKEMSKNWENSPHYTKDREAKKWAKYIVEQL